MNIYVGNISFETSEDNLKTIFGEYGEVASVKIIMDRETGRSRGFGFVEMSDDDQGRTAIAEVNGKEFNGRNLRVNEARERSDNRGGGGGGRGRY
ncbi:MAG: RNA-binding protein [Candidatus Zixiibacteriota bacterium]|nr:MAG: RNA-binding protein [candidate division Zixibacteria bacterium]